MCLWYIFKMIYFWGKVNFNVIVLLYMLVTVSIRCFTPTILLCRINKSQFSRLFWRRLQDVFARQLQKTFSIRPLKISLSILQDVFTRRLLWEAFKKMSCKHVMKAPWKTKNVTLKAASRLICNKPSSRRHLVNTYHSIYCMLNYAGILNTAF